MPPFFLDHPVIINNHRKEGKYENRTSRQNLKTLQRAPKSYLWERQTYNSINNEYTSFVNTSTQPLIIPPSLSSSEIDPPPKLVAPQSLKSLKSLKNIPSLTLIRSQFNEVDPN